jgi:integrase
MSTVVLAPREAPSLPPTREVELLRGGLDGELLAELGWDPKAMVVRAVRGHPSFGFVVCEVPGCELPGIYRGNVCTTCYQRFTKWVTAGRFSGDLEEFKRVPREPAGRLPERLCVVCCVPPDHVRPARANGLCNAHEAKRKYHGLTVEEFLAGDDLRPYPAFGVCRREGCQRWADNRLVLCRQCEKVWQSRGRPELTAFHADRYTVLEEVAMVAPISLAGLPEQLTLELLFVAQQFTLQKRKRSREAWRGLVRDARAAGVASLLELERIPMTRRVVGVLMVRKLAQRELEVLYADPETEFASDVWDLRKVGLAVAGGTQVLDFSMIAQDWLREATKGWARYRAAYTQGTSLKATMLAVSLLSESLTLREDRGDEKAMLARSDVRAFVERLGRLYRAGRLPDTTYYRSAGKMRQFLRECRDFGLYEPGGPLHGLSAEFAVWVQDLRKPPQDEDANSEGRALPQVVIDQLLSDAYLARLGERYGEDVLVMLRILADTGRRPEEVAKLWASCLDRTEFVDQQTGELQSSWVLVHDMPKVAIKDFRLFISESTAQLIIEWRERIVARYPGRPLSQLRLFPRERMNPDGTVPLYTSRLSWAVRRWVQNLPELLGPSGEEFPRERVFPYAFRHSFAQRHADHGTPIDVLSEMMGHRTMDTTRGYYKVNKARMRQAVATVSEMQLNHRGHRVTADLAELVDAEYDRYQVGQIAVAFGTCHEPSNVKSSGQACPYRFRCFGCAHFRTDPSYLPELREHLQRLLVDHERLNTATGGMLEDWARRDALPAPEEIVAVRRLIRAAETVLDGLTAQERAAIDELFAVIRRARASIETALPAHVSAGVRQPRPALYPRSAGGASG